MKNKNSIHRFLSLPRFTLWVLLFLACFPALFAREKPCAILLGGFDNDARVIGPTGEVRQARIKMELYPGDRIEQKTKTQVLRIKCSPFTSIQIDDAAGMVRVIYSPPREGKSILAELSSFMGFEKDKQADHVVAARDLFNADSDLVVPQPPNGSSLLPGEMVLFAWGAGEKGTIVFRNDKNEEIFRRDVGSQSSVLLTPKSIGLKPRVAYTWEIERMDVPMAGSRADGIQVLDEAATGWICGDLNGIDAETPDAIEAALKKASYCQFISDTYSGGINLYWMSYRLLREIPRSRMKAESRVLFRILLERCFAHFEG